MSSAGVSVNISEVDNDSAFGDSEAGYQETGSDITSSFMSGDSGKPISPEGSLPFTPPETECAQTSEQKTENDLPPWLEAVSFVIVSKKKHIQIAKNNNKYNSI